MVKVLGRKQCIKNEDWIKAFNNIRQLVSREELKQLVLHTVEEVKKNTKGKKTA